MIIRIFNHIKNSLKYVKRKKGIRRSKGCGDEKNRQQR